MLTEHCLPPLLTALPLPASWLSRTSSSPDQSMARWLAVLLPRRELRRPRELARASMCARGLALTRSDEAQRPPSAMKVGTPVSTTPIHSGARKKYEE